MTHQAPALARWLATWFGCGRSPVAPGTVGSLATLPVHYGLKALGAGPHAALTVGLTLAGTWAAHVVARSTGDDDPSSVVIDEVSGTLIALGIAASSGPLGEFVALVLFRLLDIFKPGVIDAAQRLRPAGLGIMADDVLAGLAAGALVRAAFPLLT